MATFKTLGGRTIEVETEVSTNEKISNATKNSYRNAGSIPFAELPDELTDSIVGNAYNIIDAFTTDSRFLEGNGAEFKAGTNVVVVKNNGVIKFDVFSASGDTIIPSNGATDEQIQDVINDIWND